MKIGNYLGIQRPGIVDGGFKFLKSLATFTPGMAKRSAPGPFTAAPIVQGNWDGSMVPDSLELSRGSQVVNNFYQMFDVYQATIILWWTPEKDADALVGDEYLFSSGGFSLRYEPDNTRLRMVVGGQNSYYSLVSVAGTTYNIVCRFDTKNTIDGTNYTCISVNDSHSFGTTSQPNAADPGNTQKIGAVGTTHPANAIIEGLTIYRRVLYDGTYGTDIGNSDEINQIYNAGVGKDPTLITGSWDVVFCMPTNSTVGPLVTGVGEAWSHPHSSAVLGDTFLANRDFAGNILTFDGDGDYLNCGNDSTLIGLPLSDFTVEVWVRNDGQVGLGALVAKAYGAAGWVFWTSGNGDIRFLARYSTTDLSKVTDDTNLLEVGGGWRHVAAVYDSTTKDVEIFVDGISRSLSGSTGVGSYSNDSSKSLYIGARDNGTYDNLNGAIAWARISSNKRYSADFTPPSLDTPPSDDGNTISLWRMEEGSGTTVADSNANGNDGTISGATWRDALKSHGSPLTPKSVEFDGSSTYIDCGSDASLDDLGEFTVEGWFYDNDYSRNMYVVKGNWLSDGWQLYRNDTSGNNRFVFMVKGDSWVISQGGINTKVGAWNHVVGYYNDTTKQLAVAVNGIWQPSASLTGSYVSDASFNLFIGSEDGTTNRLNGKVAWVRISSNDRYDATTPTDFTPPSRTNPPADDVNTVSLWRMEEGAGATVADSNANGNDGTITSGSWKVSKDMAADAPGERIYNWGYVFGADATDEGAIQTLTGLTAGQSYVSRVIAHTDAFSGSNDHITLQVWDETNDAEITSFDFGANSSAAKPAIAIITWDGYYNGTSFTGYTSISIRVLANTVGATVYVHQVEVQENIITNPSMETGIGDPFILTSWSNSNLDAGDSEKETSIVHSGASALKLNPGALSSEATYRGVSVYSTGGYVSFGGWSYGNTGDFAQSGTAKKQATLSENFSLLGTGNNWSHLTGVARMANTSSWFLVYGSGETFYVDDAYAFKLDPVSLTVTPASEANSLEGNGIRVDGFDALTQPIPAGKLKATSGEISFNWTPRHGVGDYEKFGYVDPSIALAIKDSSNYILLYADTNSNLRMLANSGGTFAYSNNWAGGVSGTTYNVKITYDSTSAYVYFDGTLRLTASPVGGINFGINIPDVLKLGSNHVGTIRPIDAVFS